MLFGTRSNMHTDMKTHLLQGNRCNNVCICQVIPGSVMRVGSESVEVSVGHEGQSGQVMVGWWMSL